MIHNIRFRVFVYKNEDENKLRQAIFNIFPDAEIECVEAEGLIGDSILILTGVVDKKRDTRDFFNRLLSLDGAVLDKLVDDLDRKMDDKGNLFLRLSKDGAIDDKMEIVDFGDAIHLKIKIAAYPARKDIAVLKVRQFILDNK